MRRRVAVAVEGAALGAVLAGFDFGLHVDAEKWVSAVPLRSLLAMVIVYGAGLGLLGLVLPRRVLFGGAILAFAAGQLGLAAYRTNVEDDLARSAGAIAAVLAVLGGLLWVSIRREVSPEPGRLRAAACVAVAVLCLGAFALIVPREPAPPIPPLPPVASGTPDPTRPNLLLVTLDTVRPDHLSAYGYDAIETAAIDAIAKGGVLFENAVAQAPLTPPSHASMLTGLTPAAHGLRDFARENRLREGVPTLAEVLAARGYRTGAIVASPPLDPSFGLDRGFQGYRLVLPQRFYPFRKALRTLLATSLAQSGILPNPAAYRPADPQVDDAIAWLTRSRGTSFFLWLHLFDAHEPYAPPPPGMPAPAQGRSGRTFLYDGEIVRLDRALGRLFAHLTALGLDERTLVVLASDHGDGLGEHGYLGHTARLYREQMDMVLLLRWPGRLPQGARVPAQVRSIDLFPTVLGLLGTSAPPSEGTDLRPWIAGEATADLPASSETLDPQEPSRRLLAFDDGRFKLIRTVDRSRTWLFDHLHDPHEEVDLSGAAAEPVARLARELDARLEAALATAVRIPAPPEGQAVDAELRERLESLGYLK